MEASPMRGRRALGMFIALQVLIPLVLLILRWVLHDGVGVTYWSSWQMYSVFP
jgi:uncharacterized membrane protein